MVKLLLFMGLLALVGCGASAAPETPIASVAVPVPIQEQETPGQVEDAGVEALERRVAELEERVAAMDEQVVALVGMVLDQLVEGKEELTHEDCVSLAKKYYTEEQWNQLGTLIGFTGYVHAGEQGCDDELFYQQLPLQDRLIVERIRLLHKGNIEYQQIIKAKADASQRHCIDGGSSILDQIFVRHC